MEKTQHKVCCLEKFMAEGCNETTYCRNAGRLDICTFHKKNIYLVHQKTLYTFKNNDNTICFYQEKVYHSCHEALQIYCFDPYQMHKKY